MDLSGAMLWCIQLSMDGKSAPPADDDDEASPAAAAAVAVVQVPGDGGDE